MSTFFVVVCIVNCVVKCVFRLCECVMPARKCLKLTQNNDRSFVLEKNGAQKTITGAPVFNMVDRSNQVLNI